MVEHEDLQSFENGDPNRQQQLARRLRALLSQVSDEEHLPETDEELLRALVRNELEEADAKAVFRLIHASKAWRRAHERIVIEEFQHWKNGQD